MYRFEEEILGILGIFVGFCRINIILIGIIIYFIICVDYVCVYISKICKILNKLKKC